MVSIFDSNKHVTNLDCVPDGDVTLIFVANCRLGPSVISLYDLTYGWFVDLANFKLSNSLNLT